MLWNTVYLQRATDALRKQGHLDEALLPYLSPLGWEHINLTGDYVWRSRSVPSRGRFRPLRPSKSGGLAYVIFRFLRGPQSEPLPA